jgi:hypothetical protein
MACTNSSCPNYTPLAEELCDPCEEYDHQIKREDFAQYCLHCGKTFMPGGFDQHCMGIYYREGYYPRGRRVKM